MKKFAMTALAAAALGAVMMTGIGCAGSGGLGSSATKGFLTFLERVVTGGVASYFLRRVEVGTDVVIDLNSYPDLGLEGLLEGPSDTLFSTQSAGADQKIVRLGPAGATDVATIADGFSEIVSGPNGFVILNNSSAAVGEPILIQRLSYSGGAPVDAFSVNAGEATELGGVTVSKTGDVIYFAAGPATIPSEGVEQIQKVTGTADVETIPVKFTGRISGIAHSRVGGVDFIYYLEEAGADVKLGRVRLSDNTNEVIRTFAGTTSQGMTADFDTEVVGFALAVGSARRVYQVEGTSVTEVTAASASSVTGVVFR